MALQSSGPISLSDIKTELGSSANDFRSLHAAAGFSTPDSISEFYGYSAVSWESVSISESGFEDPGIACGEGPNFGTFRIFYDAGAGFRTGTTVYTSEGGEVFDGRGFWYYVADLAQSVFIDSRGALGEIVSC